MSEFHYATQLAEFDDERGFSKLVVSTPPDMKSINLDFIMDGEVYRFPLQLAQAPVLASLLVTEPIRKTMIGAMTLERENWGEPFREGVRLSLPTSDNWETVSVGLVNWSAGALADTINKLFKNAELVL